MERARVAAFGHRDRNVVAFYYVDRLAVRLIHKANAAIRYGTVSLNVLAGVLDRSRIDMLGLSHHEQRGS